MTSVSVNVSEDELLDLDAQPPVSVTKRKKRLSYDMEAEIYSRRHHMGLVGEPYMTPFLLFNLLMRDLDCPVATCEEVTSIIQRFNSVQQSFFSTESSRPRKKVKEATQPPKQTQGSSSFMNLSSQQSILMQASQVYSQKNDNNGNDSTHDGVPNVGFEHSNLLDVMSGLCASRGLRFTERSAGPRDRNRKTFIYPKDVAVRKKAIIIADAKRPFFAVVVAAPRHLSFFQRKRLNKKAMRKNVDAEQEENPFLVVLVCTPDALPFRILLRNKPVPVTAAQVLIAQIERPDAVKAPADAADSATAEATKKDKSRGKKRGRDSAGIQEGSTKKAVGGATKEGVGAPLLLGEDRYFYPHDGKKYMKFGKYPIFTEQDQVGQDPFLQIRPSEFTSRAKKSWTERIRQTRRTTKKTNRL